MVVRPPGGDRERVSSGAEGGTRQASFRNGTRPPGDSRSPAGLAARGAAKAFMASASEQGRERFDHLAVKADRPVRSAIVASSAANVAALLGRRGGKARAANQSTA